MARPSLVNKPFIDRCLNGVLILCLLAAGAAFWFHTGGYGLLLAPVAAVIAFGVFRHNRWGYFASGAWSLACYQLAKEGLEFEVLKRIVMSASIPLVALSIYLHESLVRAPAKRTGD